MTCPRIEETSTLFDRSLPEDEVAALQTHVAGCRDCSEFLRDFEVLRNSLRALAVSPADEPRQTWWKRRVTVPVALLANAVVAVVVAVAVLIARSPEERTSRGTPAPSTGTHAFAGFDAGGAPVVYVRPREGAQR